MFSCISRRLRKHNAVTLGDLASQIKESYNPEPEVSFVSHMFDVKNWVLQHTPGFSGHSEPHQYKFEKLEGRVHMKYRKWSTSKQWLPKEEDTLHVFPKEEYPSGVPNLLPADLKSTIELLAKDLPKYGVH